MDAKIIVYFAHALSHYNTDFEKECESAIRRRFPDADIFNPNQQIVQNLYENRKNSGHENPFGIFDEIVKACDYVVGVSFHDGVLGAGVGKECMIGYKHCDDVLTLNHNFNFDYFFPDSIKILSINETRQRIRDGVI